jgi:glycine hydroxymethyltransferase
VASGIRVGTPSITTQGMGEGECKEIATMLAVAVRDADGSAAAGLRAAVLDLTGRFPAYPNI